MSRLSRPFLALVLATASFAAPVQWTVGSGGNGNFYEVITNNDLTWDAARTAATTAGGFLATITSWQENLFVWTLLSNTGRMRAFIGATDSAVEGTFRWADGTEAGNALGAYQPWGTGQPGGGTGENGSELLAAAFAFGGAGQWNDVATTGFTSAYIIEYTSLNGGGNNGGGNNGGGGNVVPEPSTMAIMAGGISALYFLRKKRA